MIERNEKGNLIYKSDTFEIELYRYTDPERLHLADSAAIYYDKPDRDNIRRPLNIIRMGHALTIFRGESATFKFFNVSKEVYDHLITYTTLNMRVAGGNRANVSESYTMPSDKMKNPVLVKRCIDQSMRNYHRLIKEGETPQVARSAMPVNAQLRPFKLQFNFQTLIEAVFPQRIWEPGAQGNTVKVVRGMYALCHAVDPELWETVLEYYGPHTKEWKLAQRKLRKVKYTLKDFLADIENDKLNLNMTLDEFIREKFGKMRSIWE